MRSYDISELESRNLCRALDWQAEHNGPQTWLHTDERRVSFAQACALVNRYAHGLQGLGLKAGHTLVMVMVPSIEVPLVALAAVRLGAIFTTINTDYHTDFLEESLETSQSRILVIDSELCARLTALKSLAAIEHIFVVGDPAPAASLGARPLSDLLGEDSSPPNSGHQPHWSDPAQIWWSSGTTGKPKGVMHSHSSLLVQANFAVSTRVREGDVMYACTPVYLGSAWTGAIWSALAGGVEAAIDSRFSVSKFWDRIRHYGATHCFTLGAMHMLLWKQPVQPGERDHTLRNAFMIPTPHELIPQFKARWGIQEMEQGYGTSETFQIFRAVDDGRHWQGSALGVKLDFYDVKLADEDGHSVAEGDVGEICVRPRQPGVIFCGYFGEPQRTLDAWRDLWHHTGDMARCDANGVYHFADRKKDYIRYKGRNISMFEVESVVDKLEWVADCAAFGVQSAELESESELALYVVLKAGSLVSAEDVARFIGERAPYYFVPRYIDFVDSLPRNAHGRILKQELRDRGLNPTTWDREKVGYKPPR